VRVDRQWPGSTVVCLATGPSLTAADVDYCRGKARVIAVNDAYRLAPWADALIGADASWWLTHRGVPSFAGEKWSVQHNTWGRIHERFPDVKRLKNTGTHGIETHPSGLRNGGNSGYLALNLAVHYGAARIVLLGYDMGHRKGGKRHFFGNHPGAMDQQSPFAQFIRAYETAVRPLADLGISVVNCSRSTYLTCFPRAPLADALSVAA
jgi:hypothetical protein